MTTTKELWENALVELELTISKPNFNTWFKDTHIVRIEDGTVALGVPSQFARDWLSTKFHKDILRSLRGLSDSVRAVEYVISRGVKKTLEEPAHTVLPAPSELPLETVHAKTNLNPRFTLQSFVVGPFNELAHAAAQAVIRNPGIAYNPLLVYGPTGLGKTHLIQAIGNHFRTQTPERKVFYVTSEKFSMDYVSSLQTDKVQSFKERYRQYDLLIMDDVQFLAGRDKIKEEFFHLFNFLHDNNKQLVFSSDQHPNVIQNLEDRLKSRFAAGMIIAVTPPDHQSRLAIVRAKAATHNVILPDEVLEYLAATIEGNVRELEGALNTLLIQFEMRGEPLTINDAKALLRSIGTAAKKAVSVQDVVRVVANFYGVEENSIYEKTRRKEVVRPRQVIMYLLREDFHISFPTIGEKLGGRDHTTVIHSCEKIKADLRSDSVLNQEMYQIRLMLK
ncbi:MAG TPA: chromosomal replication initiator protein DnaA [Candidatus Paceibacterota bacterium]|nr:chromosomal replication initiator protein DnaA [Candidatus Paceibacterota bacterium]